MEAPHAVHVPVAVAVAAAAVVAVAAPEAVAAAAASSGGELAAGGGQRAAGGRRRLAGLWTRHAGLGLSSYTVITTAATPAFAPLHHRLPMMLERDQLGAWLTGDWDAARALIQPYAGAMVATPVSNDVGKVANNYPALLDPVAVQAGLI